MSRGLSAVFLVLLSGVAAGQGFRQVGVSIGSGARALGMGGAFIAIADDATASSWNPAGLCVLESPEVSIVWKARNSASTATAAQSFETLDPANNYHSVGDISAQTFSSTGHGFDFVSFTYPVRIGKWRVVPQLNYQRVIDFRFEETADQPLFRNNQDNAGGLNSLFAQTQTDSFSGTGGIDVWAGSVGFTFSRHLYFGLAFNRWIHHAQISSFRHEDTLFCDPETCFENTADFESFNDLAFSGFNVNAGTIVKLQKWSFGFVFKSPFTMNHDVHTESRTELRLPAGNFPTLEIHEERGEIEWPETVAIGAAYNPKDILTFSADYTWSNWSSAKYTFDFQHRIVDFSGVEETQGRRIAIWPTYHDPAAPEDVFNQEQIDAYQIRFGAEYMLVKNVLIFPLRAGIYRDRQYLKDGRSENISHTGLTVGTGFIHSNVSVDFAFVHEFSGIVACDYTLTQSGSTQSCKSDGKDTFHSNRYYLSTIYRFS